MKKISKEVSYIKRFLEEKRRYSPLLNVWIKYYCKRIKKITIDEINSIDLRVDINGFGHNSSRMIVNNNLNLNYYNFKKFCRINKLCSRYEFCLERLKKDNKDMYHNTSLRVKHYEDFLFKKIIYF